MQEQYWMTQIEDTAPFAKHKSYAEARVEAETISRQTGKPVIILARCSTVLPPEPREMRRVEIDDILQRWSAAKSLKVNVLCGVLRVIQKQGITTITIPEDCAQGRRLAKAR